MQNFNRRIKKTVNYAPIYIYTYMYMYLLSQGIPRGWGIHERKLGFRPLFISNFLSF